jgi:hypothetical protein
VERLAMLAEEPPRPERADSRIRFGRFTVLATGLIANVGGLLAFLTVLAHLCTA